MTYIPDPANYTMKANPVKPESKLTVAEPLSIDLENTEALRQLAKGKLVEIIQKAPLNAKGLTSAIRELLDRIDGKAPQSINMKSVSDNNLNVTIRVVKPTNGNLLIDAQTGNVITD